MRRVAWKAFSFSLVLLMILSLAGPVALGQITRVRSTGDESSSLTAVDTLFLQARPQQALELLMTQFGPTDTVTSAQLYNHGLAERINHVGSGLVWFRKAYELDPKFYLIPWSLGKALTDEGLLIEGERYLNEAVHLDKEYYESSVDLGRNLRLQGRYEEAISATKKAFGRDRTYAPAYTELAETYLAMDRPDEALTVLQEGYQKFPYAEILVPLATLSAEQGDSSEAEARAREYLTLYPKGEKRSEMISLLNHLDPETYYIWPRDYRSTHLDNGKPFADPKEVMPAGIRLDYKIRWGLIPIGHLQIDVIEGTFRDEPAWEARYIASSLPGIPFVTIADTFYAYIDYDLRHVPLLEMRYDELGYEAIKTYLCDYDNGYFREYTRLGNGYWEYTSHPLPPGVFDASSQLWIAQQFVIEGISGTIPVELSGGFERTIINLRDKGDNFRIDGEKVGTIKLDGVMHYAGIAGMTGDFQGWYSEDHRIWPMRAKFKIFLGWVTIEYDSNQPTEMTSGFGIIR